MSERIGRLILRWRVVVLLVILGLTGFFGYKASQVEVASPVIDQFPSTHPYVETFVKYSEVFGGADRVVIQLEVKEGDIFNTETLAKVQRITRALELLPAINNYQVLSLAQKKVKEQVNDSVRGLRCVPLMWPKLPKTQEEFDHLRRRVYRNERIHGSLVSLDDKATLIIGGFFADKLDPKATYLAIEEIIEKEADDNHSFQMIGRPILLGTILYQYPQLAKLFLATIASILLLLLLYFRDLRGVLVPLTTAIVSAIWGIGFLGVLGYNFDPLVIVVPFIISARALSHSVQLVARYIEEYFARKDKTEASVAVFSGLFKPGMVAIITDAAGVMLVWLTPIPLLQKLAAMGGFWVLSIIVSDMILNPVFLSFLPAPREPKQAKKGWMNSLLYAIGRLCLGRHRVTVLAATGVVMAVGFFFARNLQVGDVHPGTPMLWPDSRYNRDTDRIARKFRNTEQFTVVVEGDSRDAIKTPEVLKTMALFQRHMEAIGEVGSTSSIADILPKTISRLHSDDPKWELIPDDPQSTGLFTELVFQGSEPGDLVRFITINSQNANINCNLRDHKGETLRKVVAHARAFIDKHPLQRAELRLAGGLGGLTAAINEEVTKHQAQVTVLAFGIICFFCAIAYRSLLAGLLFLVPLILSNYLTYALMGARQIGLDVNALPVVAVGVGLGVDYGLYVIGRIQEEYRKSRDIDTAVVTAICTAGKAVAFTAGTMVFGVVFWSFSFLRFQADMGTLLLFWMIISMLGGLILLPTLVTLIKPKFIFGR